MENSGIEKDNVEKNTENIIEKNNIENSIVKNSIEDTIEKNGIEKNNLEQSNSEKSNAEKNHIQNNTRSYNTDKNDMQRDNTESDNTGKKDIKNIDEKENIESNKRSKNAGSTKKKRTRRILISTFCVVIAILFISYGGIVLYYQSRFLPNTTVNGFDCSNLEASEVALLLENQLQGYVLEVTGRVNDGRENDVLGEVHAWDINLTLVDTTSAVENLLEQQNPFMWMERLMGNQYSNTLQQGVAFDEKMLEDYVKAWDACKTGNMVKPQDAYIGDYSEESQCFEIVSETGGTRMDVQAAIESIQNAILTHETHLDLEEQDCYLAAAVTSEDDALNKNLNMANKWLDTSVVYDWHGNEIVVDHTIIHEWITIDKNTPVLDEEAVAQFVSDTAKELDTYGKKRKFMTTLGVELTLPSGAYGWKTDKEAEAEELIQLIYQGSSLSKEPLYINIAAHKGSNDIGSSYVEVDLSNQHLYLYQNGKIVLESDFVSGDMSRGSRMTPPGVFGLTYKTTNAVLRGDDYETPVNYWMPFNGNIGMHDATWRSNFGGDIYLTNGSHGCINLPLDKAKQIYQYVSTGFPVVCYYY